MVLVVLPLSPRDAVNHGSFHFLVDFQNAEPDPVSIPTHVSSAVLSGITRLWKITGGGRLGMSGRFEPNRSGPSRVGQELDFRVSGTAASLPLGGGAVKSRIAAILKNRQATLQA
jgi:hypothetical protein